MRLATCSRRARRRLPDSDSDARRQEPPPDKDDSGARQEVDEAAQAPSQLEDVVLEAAQAAIPPDLLAALSADRLRGARSESSGKAGAAKLSARRGRPIGARSGSLRHGRLALVDTLRAAAPWQAIRRGAAGARQDCILVRTEDFRVMRFRDRRETTAIFVIDASGSAAMHRLAEAKGAVELLLGDCYARRDNVALVAFRGKIGGDRPAADALAGLRQAPAAGTAGRRRDPARQRARGGARARPWRAPQGPDSARRADERRSRQHRPQRERRAARRRSKTRCRPASSCGRSASRRWRSTPRRSSRRRRRRRRCTSRKR